MSPPSRSPSLLRRVTGVQAETERAFGLPKIGGSDCTITYVAVGAVGNRLTRLTRPPRSSTGHFKKPHRDQGRVLTSRAANPVCSSPLVGPSPRVWPQDGARWEQARADSARCSREHQPRGGILLAWSREILSCRVHDCNCKHLSNHIADKSMSNNSAGVNTPPNPSPERKTRAEQHVIRSLYRYHSA